MTNTQQKNIAWFLPRPNPSRYKGSMPLHCEKWLVGLAQEILYPGYIDTKPMRLLHLFAGKGEYGFKVDINPEVEPDLVCDAHEVSKHLKDMTFDAILADPPYSNAESKEIYGTGKLHYKVWANDACKLLEPGGLFIIYHKLVMPNPNPDLFEIVKRVFVGIRINHPPRVALYFKKMGA